MMRSRKGKIMEIPQELKDKIRQNMLEAFESLEHLDQVYKKIEEELSGEWSDDPHPYLLDHKRKLRLIEPCRKQQEYGFYKPLALTKEEKEELYRSVNRVCLPPLTTDLPYFRLPPMG